MRPEQERMAAQFEVSAADHNALNVHFEDFKDDYGATFNRIFTFLGIPRKKMENFLELAKKEDLFTKSAQWLNNSRHVTAGKHETQRAELMTLLLSNQQFGVPLRKLRTRLGYTLF